MKHERTGEFALAHAASPGRSGGERSLAEAINLPIASVTARVARRATGRRAASIAPCAAASAGLAVTTGHAALSRPYDLALLTTRDDVGHILEPESRSMSVHGTLHRIVGNPTSAHP